MDSIAILDFVRSMAQLIARRVREAQVYCELFPWDAPMDKCSPFAPGDSFSPADRAPCYEENAPYIQDFIFKTGLPILGVCYGMQALTHALGGQVDASAQREYDRRDRTCKPRTLLDAISKVWSRTATASPNSRRFYPAGAQRQHPFAAMGDMKRNISACSSIPRCITRRTAKNCSNILPLTFAEQNRTGLPNPSSRRRWNGFKNRWETNPSTRLRDRASLRRFGRGRFIGRGGAGA